MKLELSELTEQIEALRDEVIAELSKIDQIELLEAKRVEWLGKKGALTALMRNVGQLSPEDRPKFGERANVYRNEIQSNLEAKSQKLKESAIAAQLKNEIIDVTLPGRKREVVASHPISLVQDELCKILSDFGFVVEMGPEVEHEFFNFSALNMPPNHPARAMQDTFYLKGRNEEVVLRTHTSPVQVRTMLTLKPPIRMICPGRVYRSDYDATHSPMFHQVEGLLVDRDVHMGDLIGILNELLAKFFNSNTEVRLRPSFFPFTEPSAEVDMSCVFCGGKGCRTCKGSGWIEVGGCGMVDPEVFRAVSYDTEIYRGFAFGIGIERMAMIKYGIDDLRTFYESDLRFIHQFSRWRS